jgi:hypothetical protein
MPQNYFGSWKGKSVIFYELYHRIKQETHWAFRADKFGRIIDLAKEAKGGIPELLMQVECFPKRSKEDSYKQAEKQFSLKNGNKYHIPENILGFTAANVHSKDDVKNIIYKHLDALAHADVQQCYYEQRKNDASDTLKKEITPVSGPFWTTLRSAKSDTDIIERCHVDDVITTDIACNIVKSMFGFEDENPTDWKNPSIASFASGVYSQK